MHTSYTFGNDRPYVIIGTYSKNIILPKKCPTPQASKTYGSNAAFKPVIRASLLKSEEVISNVTGGEKSGLNRASNQGL